MISLRDQLQEIFREVFGRPELVLRDEMTTDDIDGWDSLAHLNLVIAMEKRLGVKFTMTEISEMRDDSATIGDLAVMLERKRA